MYNRVILSGRLTADPDLRTASVPYLPFTIAVNNPYSRNQPTTFVKAIAWRNNATNMAKFLKRGSLILLEGQLQSNNNFLEVSVNLVYFMDSKKEQNKNVASNQNNSTHVEEVTNNEKKPSISSEKKNVNNDMSSDTNQNNLSKNNVDYEQKNHSRINIETDNNENNIKTDENFQNVDKKEEGIDWDAI